MNAISKIIKCFIQVNSFEKTVKENMGVMETLRNTIAKKISALFLGENGETPEKLFERKQKKHRILYYYQEYLDNFSEVVMSQRDLIKEISTRFEEIDDVWDRMMKLRNQLLEMSMQICGLEASMASVLLEEEELHVLKHLQVFDLLNMYQNVSDKSYFCFTQWKHKQTKETASIDWRSYFFSIVTAYIQLNLDVLSRGTTSESQNEKSQDTEMQIANFRGQISNAVYYKRRRKNWTQAQLSKQSGVGRSMIAKVEQLQQTTSLETAIRLLVPLDMTLAIVPCPKVNETLMVI